MQSIPVCSSAINLGTISNSSVSLLIKFVNNSTGREMVIPGVSNSSGVCVASLSEKFPVNNSFTLTIYLASDTSLKTPINVTIGSSTGNQIQTSFRACYEFQDINHAIGEFELAE